MPGAPSHVPFPSHCSSRKAGASMEFTSTPSADRGSCWSMAEGSAGACRLAGPGSADAWAWSADAHANKAPVHYFMSRNFQGRACPGYNICVQLVAESDLLQQKSHRKRASSASAALSVAARLLVLKYDGTCFYNLQYAGLLASACSRSDSRSAGSTLSFVPEFLEKEPDPALRKLPDFV